MAPPMLRLTGDYEIILIADIPEPIECTSLRQMNIETQI